MKIIGVCGGSGSGKSTVSACLGSYGGIVLDADKIYHRLIESPSPCVEAIAKEFGSGVLSGDAIDRAKLREIVFSDDEKLRALNAITHKYVIDEIEKGIDLAARNGVPYIIIDAPLLLESGLDKRCDLVIAVLANSKTRIDRIVSRDGITKEAARERIEKQIPEEELSHLCDAVIRNDTSIEDLQKQCKDLLTLMGLNNEKE